MHTITHFAPPAVTAIQNAGQFVGENQNSFFWCLFAFRYLRLILHIISYLFIYKSAPVPGIGHGKYTRKDCTVIVPTVDPTNKEFLECIKFVLMNVPKALILTTVGKQNARICSEIFNSCASSYAQFTEMTVVRSNIANKRRQFAAAIPNVRTDITLLVDDHVFWPEGTFIPDAIAPFEDPAVGCVGTKKLMRRKYNSFFGGFRNFLGCTHLARQNFELTAINTIDRGVTGVSGHTSIVRTEILQDPAFLKHFTDGSLLGKFGSLDVDDDSFVTRWLASHGWKTKFQNTKAATIETILGDSPKVVSQILRSARATWRSNATSLFIDRTVWWTRPWCVYAVHLSGLVNFALIYDATLLYFLYYTTSFGHNITAMYTLGAWIFASKMVKLLPHFIRCPWDVVMIPAYILFAYAHSFIKLYALLTFWKITRSSRDLTAVNRKEDDLITHTEKEFDYKTLYDAPTDAEDSLSYSNEDSLEGSDRSSTLVGSNIDTPWGAVRRNNPVYQPANTLEGLITLQPALKRRYTPEHQLRSNLNWAVLKASDVSSESDTSDICMTDVPSTASSVTLGPYSKSSSRSSSRKDSASTSLSPFFAEDGFRDATKPDWDLESPIISRVSPCSGNFGHQSACFNEDDFRDVTNTAWDLDSTTSLGSEYIPYVPVAPATTRESVRHRRNPPAPINRQWTRGTDCRRAHEGRCMLDAWGKCQIGDVRNVMWNGR